MQPIRTESDAIRFLEEHGLQYGDDRIEGAFVIRSARCHRCGGSGYINYYGHVMNGVCFECKGADTRDAVDRIPIKTYAQRYKAKIARQIREREKAEAKQRILVEKIATWKADNPEVARILQSEDPTLRSLAHNLENWGSLTDKQVKLALTIAARLEERKVSQHVGKVGEREEFDLTYVTNTSWDNAYGLCVMYMFEDENKNAFVWRTGDFNLDAEKGEKVRVRATVKEHGEYRDQKQTVLTRVVKK